MSIFQANSVSSTPSIELSESLGQTDYVISSHEGCLDDVVQEVTWSSAAEPWIFGGVSYRSSVYFDNVPEKEKLRIIL